MSTTVTPILELPDNDPSMNTILPNITTVDTKPVQYVGTKMPVHHDFYRHTFLSWARLRERPKPTQPNPQTIVIEKPFYDADDIPSMDPLGTEIDVQAIKQLVNYIGMMGLTMGLFMICLVIGILSLIYGLQPKVPTGTILSYSGNAATLLKNDDQWLFCDGAAISRTKYSALFLVIGTTYGAGNGVDTFNLPDLRSRFLWGSNGTNDTVLISGGAATHTLTIAEIPSHDHDQGSFAIGADGAHTHNINDPWHDHGGSTGPGWHSSGGGQTWNSGSSWTYGTAFTSHSIQMGPTGISVIGVASHTHTISGLTGMRGGDQPFDKMPPYQTVHHIIRI